MNNCCITGIVTSQCRSKQLSIWVISSFSIGGKLELIALKQILPPSCCQLDNRSQTSNLDVKTSYLPKNFSKLVLEDKTCPYTGISSYSGTVSSHFLASLGQSTNYNHSPYRAHYLFSICKQILKHRAFVKFYVWKQNLLLKCCNKTNSSIVMGM